MNRPLGLRLIIAYKLARAVLQLGAAVVLFVHRRVGAPAALLTWALETKRHFAHVLWETIARALVAGAHHLTAVAVALALDAGIAAFEAFALARGYRWSAWLVVVTTSVPLPWEVVELARHPHAGRFALLALNLAVVAYLGTRAVEHGRPS